MTTHADRPRTVAVAGGKGGCGKTTTALGLALGLVRAGRRPLVVDADVDVPDLHIRAGVDRKPGLARLAAGDPPVRVWQPSPAFPGVDVLPAGRAGPSVEAALAALSGLTRPVVVDCPAGAGPDAAAPLRVADATVLVTTTAPASRRDAAKTRRMATALDAPPAATVVRGRDGEVEDRTPADGAVTPRIEPVAGPGGSPPAIHVPQATGDPLGCEQVRDRYRELARVVA